MPLPLKFGAIYPLSKKQYKDVAEVKKYVDHHLKKRRPANALGRNDDIDFFNKSTLDLAVASHLYALTGDKEALTSSSSNDVFYNTKKLKALFPQFKDAEGFALTGEDIEKVDSIQTFFDDSINFQPKPLSQSDAFAKLLRKRSGSVKPFIPDKV